MRSEDFQATVLRNPVHAALLDNLNELGLPDAWIVAGCLAQTVWNWQTGRPIDHGINDYDVFYFDPDLRCSTDGIDRFLTRCTMVGIQRDRLYAPAGLDDIAALTARPNVTPNFSARAYRSKTARWKTLWPELTVLEPDADEVVADRRLP
jgi:hypothetical protein